jgi:anti-sigma regulatory factor (Ser/Thr protein kinase)
MAHWREAPDLEKGLRLDLRLEARPENVSDVRRALERLDMPASLLDDAILLASELVTNSIRHSGLRPDQFLHLRAYWSGRALRVTVRDRAEGAEPSTVVGSIRPSPGAESGWGLYFVVGSPVGGGPISMAGLGTGSSWSRRPTRKRSSSVDRALRPPLRAFLPASAPR